MNKQPKVLQVLFGISLLLNITYMLYQLSKKEKEEAKEKSECECQKHK